MFRNSIVNSPALNSLTSLKVDLIAITVLFRSDEIFSAELKELGLFLAGFIAFTLRMIQHKRRYRNKPKFFENKRILFESACVLAKTGFNTFQHEFHDLNFTTSLAGGGFLSHIFAFYRWHSVIIFQSELAHNVHIRFFHLNSLNFLRIGRRHFFFLHNFSNTFFSLTKLLIPKPSLAFCPGWCAASGSLFSEQL